MAAKTHRTAAPTTVLSTRALNRATLDRQLLLRRSPMSAKDAVTRLVGLQAQNTKPPYFQLYARLADFDPEELSALMEAREVVRPSPALHPPHPYGGRRAHPGPAGAGTARPGAEVLPARAGRWTWTGSRRRPRSWSRSVRARWGAARGTPHPLAGRRPPRALRRRPLCAAPGPGHPARAVGPQRAGRPDHRRAVARPVRRIRARAHARRHRAALPGRVRPRLGDGLPVMGGPHPHQGGLRTAAARAAHLPGRAGRRALRPPGRPAPRPGHPWPRPASCPSSTTSCSATPTAPASSPKSTRGATGRASRRTAASSSTASWTPSGAWTGRAVRRS